MPAMIARTIGARVSAPGPQPIAAGTAPATVAIDAIKIGRSRNRVQACKIVRRQNLPLDDREVNLDLVRRHAGSIQGGKGRLGAASFLVVAGKLSCHPALTPALRLTHGQADAARRFLGASLGMLMPEQNQA